MVESKSERADTNARGAFSRRVLVYLSATILQAALVFLALPLATKILGPVEYGVYALLTSIALAAGTVAEVGQTVLFSGHFSQVTTSDRRSMLFTALVGSTGMAVLGLFAFVLSWPYVGGLLGITEVVSGVVLWLAAACIPLRAVNTTMSQYLAVADRSGIAALLIGLQAVAIFTTTMVSLFVFDLGLLSLFMAATTGLLVAVVVGTILLRHDMTMSLNVKWIWGLLHVAPSSIFAAAGDNIRAAIENSLMSRFIGVNQVGLWAHARQYYALLLQGTNSVAFVLWPKALREARGSDQFEAVGRAWAAIYLGLVLAGTFFALLGREVVAVLTNGKFVDAAIWIPVWVAYLLVQNSGKAATAVVYASGKGVWAANFRIVSLLPCIPALWFLVPMLGMGGVMIVLFAEMLIFRILIAYSAQRIREIPFQDNWVVAGCALILGLVWVVANVSLELSERITILVLVAAAVMLVGRKVFLDGFQQLRGVFRSGVTISAATGAAER